jgi:hypothetical protein
VGWQPPQAVPAPHARPMSSSERAPPSTHSRMTRSQTLWQWQTSKATFWELIVLKVIISFNRNLRPPGNRRFPNWNLHVTITTIPPHAGRSRRGRRAE